MTKSQEKFRSKLGTSKGVERSRIWIEGKRLVEAGFTVGSYFVKEYITPKPNSTTRFYPTLMLTLLKDDDVLTTMPCKVSGKGEKPIIDITGAAVFEAFGQYATHVEVDYKPGVITITPALR